MRVRLSGSAEQGLSVAIADPSGAPVASIGALITRPVAQEQLRAAAGTQADSLYRLAWREIPLPEATETDTELWQIEPEPGPDPAAAALASAEAALAKVQQWLSEEQPEGARLALLTQGAIAVEEGESPELAAAPLWGLLRSAQSENPGSFVLVDTDAGEASRAVLEVALGSGEPQLAIRQGRLLAGRVVRVGLEEQRDAVAINPNTTTLITGASGGLGPHFARHLVKEHGARHLLLLSRRGTEADGAAELAAELEELGAEVSFASCDVSDRAALAAEIDRVPAEHPLGAVIHCAGVLDDGVFASLDPQRLQSVFAPKVDAAWNLHELTSEMELSDFVLFSSISATIGSPGQANYAAANAFLEALAAKRRAEGLAGIALGWGAWQQPDGMTAALSDTDRARIARTGIGALALDEGLELFDRARLLAGSSLPVRLDFGALRSAAGAGTLAPLMSELVRAPARRERAGAGSLAQRLAQTPDSEREAVVLELVRAQAAAVLGHSSADALPADRTFKDSGFDSLSAVELRNRLTQATGLRLPSTLVFDHPSPEALAGFVRGQVGEGGSAQPRVNAELDRVEALLASVEGAEKMQAVARLRSLLSAASVEEAEEEHEHGDLESVSDEEVIKLIDEEFGAI
jgi:NADP-dependent 3-hydroxy acid dehydrogenase YdfG/acyl carrier protein